MHTLSLRLCLLKLICWACNEREPLDQDLCEPCSRIRDVLHECERPGVCTKCFSATDLYIVPSHPMIPRCLPCAIEFQKEILSEQLSVE